MEEFEIKFLEVDVPALEQKLLGIGAEKVGEYDYHMMFFDYPDLSMGKKNSWLKLRTDGKYTTLSYKERLGVKSNDGSQPDDGMKEIEIAVDGFEKMRELLLSIGLIIKRESKNKRVRYKNNEVVFDIDFWPRIPVYVEIESSSLEQVKEAANELGFDVNKGLICSPQEVYMKYGINIEEYSYLSFEEFRKK